MTLRRATPYWAGKVGGEFDPTSIGDCEIWLDASDDSTITREGTIEFESTTLDLVRTLSDKSGNSRDVEQPTEGNRPAVSSFTQNGKQLITSISTGRWLWSQSDFTLSGYPVTIFLIGKQQSGVYASYAQPSVNNRRILFNNQSETSGNFQVRSATAGNAGITPDTSLTQQDFYVYEGIAQNDDLRRFAVNEGAYSDNTENILYTSSTRFFLFRSSNQNPIGINDGHFGEAIMYSKLLTTQERSDIIDYLSVKWGITL